MLDDKEYMKILRDSDNANSEAPSGFDWAKAEFRFLELAEQIKKTVNVTRIEGQGAIQDASFHGEIFLNEGPSSQWQSVQVSNFGWIATIRNLEQLSPEKLEKLIKTLTAHGYQYVPLDILNRPYDGLYDVNSWPGHDTWYDRYFNYV